MKLSETAAETSAESTPASGRFDTRIWVLIYAGLSAVCLSLFLPQQAASLSLVLLTGGGLAVVAGIALIVIRSRLNRH